MSISHFNFTAMEKETHRGKKLERILRGTKQSLAGLAGKIRYKNKIGINRMTLYNWFEDPQLSIDKILAVAKQVPEVAEAFTELELTRFTMEQEANYLKESGTLSIECQKQINYWRNETISLQRRIMELQETIITLKSAN